MALYAFNGTWNSEKTDVQATPDNEYHTNTNVLKFRDARLAAGDATIDVVGFGRGAALAMAFTNRVYKQVIDPRTGKRPVIRCVGLWDVVGSFGIPINRPVPLPEIQLRIHTRAARHGRVLLSRWSGVRFSLARR